MFAIYFVDAAAAVVTNGQNYLYMLRVLSGVWFIIHNLTKNRLLGILQNDPAVLLNFYACLCDGLWHISCAQNNKKSSPTSKY